MSVFRSITLLIAWKIIYFHLKTKEERKAMLGVEMPKEPANRDDYNHYEINKAIRLPSSVRALNGVFIKQPTISVSENLLTRYRWITVNTAAWHQ